MHVYDDVIVAHTIIQNLALNHVL